MRSTRRGRRTPRVAEHAAVRAGRHAETGLCATPYPRPRHPRRLPGSQRRKAAAQSDRCVLDPRPRVTTFDPPGTGEDVAMSEKKSATRGKARPGASDTDKTG